MPDIRCSPAFLRTTVPAFRRDFCSVTASSGDTLCCCASGCGHYWPVEAKRHLLEGHEGRAEVWALLSPVVDLPWSLPLSTPTALASTLVTSIVHSAHLGTLRLTTALPFSTPPVSPASALPPTSSKRLISLGSHRTLLRVLSHPFLKMTTSPFLAHSLFSLLLAVLLASLASPVSAASTVTRVPVEGDRFPPRTQTMTSAWGGAIWVAGGLDFTTNNIFTEVWGSYDFGRT